MSAARARSRMSAASASRCSAAPPSIVTETFGASLRVARGCRQSLTQRRRERHGIRGSLRLQAGERIDQDRNAVGSRDAKRRNRIGKMRRRCRRQAAHLDAAARRDLDDAVAVSPRRRAQRRNGIEPHRVAARREPHQKPVAGLHRRDSGPGRRRGVTLCRGAFMTWPPRSGPRGRHLRRCGADATSRCGARSRAGPRCCAPRLGFRAAGMPRTRASARLGLVHQIDQRARHRVGRLRERRPADRRSRRARRRRADRAASGLR